MRSITFQFALAILALTTACTHYEVIPTDQIARVNPQGKEIPVRPKRRILVLPTLNKTPHGGSALADHANAVISDAIVGMPDILLVKPAEFLDSKNFKAANGLEYNWKLIFDRARASGAIGAIGSSLEDLWYREEGDDVGLFRSKHRTTGVRVHLDLFDIQSEQLVHQTSHVGELTEELLRLYTHEREPLSYDADNGKNAAARALQKPLKEIDSYLARLGWSGRIAKIDFQRYYINAGELSGLLRGQLLKVFGDGPPIFDPDTNVFIGQAPGTFKGVLRIIDFFGRDGAVAVIHSGGSFKERDRIEAFGEAPGL